MRTPAAAIAWEFRARHRWGLTAIVAYLCVLALIRFLVVGAGQRVDFRSAETFALAVVVPLTSTFIYFLAVFTFGLSGDLAARQSMFPARMFTLPLTTNALVGWPMLYGAAAISALWFATRILAVWPAGADVPIVWPAVAAASLLAWTQALTWMSYPLRGLRVIVTVFWLGTIDAIALVALDAKASELAMVAIFAPQLPLAFQVARSAVARARRGDVPDWRLGMTGATGRAINFRSAAAAQLWFESRRYGRSLPWLVAMLLPVELTFLFLFRHYPAIVVETLTGVLLTPPFMATFVAPTVSDGVTSFLATRPLSDAALIAVKFNAAIRSALVTWFVTIGAIAIAVGLSGTGGVVRDVMQRLVGVAGIPRAIVIVSVVLAALIASTWKQLVQSLYIGMTGRQWLVKGSVFAALAVLAVAVPLIDWIFNSPQAAGVLWNLIPWIAAVLVFVKLSIAAWIAMRLREKRVVSDRMLLVGAASFDVLVFLLLALLVWMLPALLFRTYLLALLAILLVPLTRVSAAPLALAWNRHR